MSQTQDTEVQPIQYEADERAIRAKALDLACFARKDIFRLRDRDLRLGLAHEILVDAQHFFDWITEGTMPPPRCTCDAEALKPDPLCAVHGEKP